MAARSRFHFLTKTTPSPRSAKKSRVNRRSSRRRAKLEVLENRRVLALLGINPSFPQAFANNVGAIQYDASSDLFSASGDPLTFQQSFFDFPPSVISAPRDFQLQFEVDAAGQFVKGVPGSDFVIEGAIDIDKDSTIDVSGVLLTGEVVAFGFEDVAASTSDTYDVRLVVTGGELASIGTLSGGGTRPAYFAGQDIGIRINSEVSTFNGDFNVDFQGGNKSVIGPITADPSFLAELGNYVWVDTNNNGLQDDGNTGVNGVTVNLYSDVDGDGIAEPGGDDGAPVQTDVTSDLAGVPGFYLFEDLLPGDYFVEFDTATIPASFVLTDDDVGVDDAIDSDADPISGLTVVTNLQPSESDLTWDAGLVLPFDPAIEIIKYVDKVTTSSEMNIIDFDSLAPGEIVGTQFPGVVIEAKNSRQPYAGNRAMVFDSSNPSGGDHDLGTPNNGFGGPGVGSGGQPNGAGPNDVPLGNVLIISEDGDGSDPDDEAHGGTLTFDFDSPVSINYLDLLDIDSDESGGSVVTLTTSSGTQTISIPAIGNNSVQRIAIDVDDVELMKVDFVSSGGDFRIEVHNDNGDQRMVRCERRAWN